MTESIERVGQKDRRPKCKKTKGQVKSGNFGIGQVKIFFLHTISEITIFAKIILWN